MLARGEDALRFRHCATRTAQAGGRCKRPTAQAFMLVFSNGGRWRWNSAMEFGRRVAGRAFYRCGNECMGGVAQLGERNVRNVEVVGSIPITSTRIRYTIIPARPGSPHLAPVCAAVRSSGASLLSGSASLTLAVMTRYVTLAECYAAGSVDCGSSDAKARLPVSDPRIVHAMPSRASDFSRIRMPAQRLA